MPVPWIGPELVKAEADSGDNNKQLREYPYKAGCIVPLRNLYRQGFEPV